MSAELLRKLTIKTCGFDKSTISATLGDAPKVELLRVVGVTTKATPGQSDLGEFVKLSGQFRAVNMATGETYESAVAILPNFIADTLADALENSPEVEFALSIGAKANKTSVTGYEYTVTPLVEAKVSDKMGALLSAAGIDKPLALEAPKATKKAAK